MTKVTKLSPVARRRQWNFSQTPAALFADSDLDTYLMLGLSLLFPAGERMFIRAARNAQHLAATEAEREAIRNFIAQEANHTTAHIALNEQIEALGIRTETFQRIFETLFTEYGEELYTKIFGENFRLAFTAAGEHFTATWAAEFLRSGRLDAVSDTEVRRLLGWHIWEEIEHRSVAFDLLKTSGATYALRIFAMGVTALYMALLLGGSVTYFALNDRDLNAGKFLREIIDDLLNRRRFSWTHLSVKTVLSYLPLDFHPTKEDISDLLAYKEDLLEGMTEVRAKAG